MESNLRDLATIEETYFTDHLHYAGAHGLRSQDLSYVTLTTGQVVVVHLGHWNYCLAGRVAPHHWFVYGSADGGLRGPKRSDTCSPTTYPRLAGRLRPSQ